MAIGTYAELQTAIASWGKRTDLTSLIPDFITLAETRIGRSLEPRGMETETELVTVLSSRYVALPTGVSMPSGLWMKDFTPRRELQQRLPTTIPVSDVSGNPDYWCIDGSNIAFDRPASAVWDFDFRYQAPFALSASNTTNYILTSYPDVYLWASLIELAGYTLDGNTAALYEGRYQAALRDAQNEENAFRDVELVTELGAGSRHRIFEG